MDFMKQVDAAMLMGTLLGLVLGGGAASLLTYFVMVGSR